MRSSSWNGTGRTTPTGSRTACTSTPPPTSTTIGGAYVWNFSSPTAKFTSGEVSGNPASVLSGDTYYFIPACGPTFPGQCSTLSLPATITGRIVSSTSLGVPFVDYQYNIGAGWVTYDNVSFGHMAGATDRGFLVDGFSPTPIAPTVLYDAEWDWVGAGGGSASVDKQSDIDMSLDLWNGHNYQAVPSAWNFGSNTGETASNVSDLSENLSNSTPAAHLVSGAGTLGVLYNLSDVGFLNVTVPTLLPATLLVDGAAVAFRGGWVNLTLVPGPHSIYLRNYTNGSADVTVAPGLVTLANLSGAGLVTFTESGLPPGTPWGIDLNGTNVSGSSPTVALNLPNGTYSLTYLPVPGYYRAGTSPPSVTLPGTAQFTVEFAVFTYGVEFSESGLPDSTLWWADVGGTVINSTGTTLQVSVPNGSTPYEVGSAYEFLATPSNGTIRVSSGLASPVNVEFAYRPTFIVGTVAPTGAEVSIGGVVQPLSAGAFNDSVVPGTYSVLASAAGYTTESSTVTATAGNVTWANISLVANHSNTTPPPAAQSSGGGISIETAALVIAGVVVVVVAALVLISRKRGVRRPPEGDPVD